ncbi:MAG: hypothetical protein SNJ50_21630, partial [Cyanobacteriota bacterium]
CRFLTADFSLPISHCRFLTADFLLLITHRAIADITPPKWRYGRTSGKPRRCPTRNPKSKIAGLTHLRRIFWISDYFSRAQPARNSPTA